MAKKIIAVLWVCVFLFSLLGCQSQPGTDPSTPTVTVTVPTTVPTTPTTVPTTVPTAPTTVPTTVPTTAPTTAPTTPTQPPVDPATIWTPLCESYINMRETPGGKLIGTVPVGAALILKKWSGNYALVSYGNIEGYVAANYIQPANYSYLTDSFRVVPITSQYSYGQMRSDMELLQAMYPDLVSVGSIGRSEYGRIIPVIKIGNPNAKYHVLIQGAIHGLEHMTAWLIMALADHALYKNILADQDVCYHLIPMSNPDGVIISQTETLDTVQEYIYNIDLANGYTTSAKAYYAQQWKANGMGVDLNRNFPSGWESSLGHTSPSAQQYRGESPLCAAESKALAAYTQSRHFDMTLSFHAYGSVLYYQYGTKQPVNQLSYSLALAVQELTGYTPVSSDGTSGAGYKDWAMDELGIPSLTIEIGSTQPPLASRDMHNIFARFENLFSTLSKWLEKNITR